LSLIGYFVSHLTRGTLSGNGRFWPYSMALGGDGALRLVVTLVLAGTGVRTAGPYGLALGITPGLAAAIAMRGQGELLGAGPEAPWGELSTALSWLLAGSVLSQSLANGSVLAVKVLATQAEQARAGQFLAGLIVARVPLFLFGAVQAALLPRLASLAGAGLHREFRSGLGRLLVVVVGVGLVGTLGAIAVGPAVVRLLFGGDFRLGRGDLGYMAVGSAVYMLCLALAQALIALGLHARSVMGWMVGNLVFLVVIMAGSNLLLRVELAFLAGSIASVVMTSLLLVSALAGASESRTLPADLPFDQLGLEP
jgi:O-antigen/teichoic acid export membrane protein